MASQFKPFAIAFIALISVAAQAKAEEAPWVLGVDVLYRLDQLPALKKSIKIGAVTSYDRTEGNDDGFSGKYSFVRKEGDDLVLADLVGPGIIYRIHTPTPTDDPLEFYFDGEAKPRLTLKVRDLFSGKVFPFVRPLVDGAGGGYTSYVPIPYKKSCKVLLRAKSFQFYDLNYATYPANAPIKSYELKDYAAKSLGLATDVFIGGKASDLTKFNVPAGTKLTKKAFDVQLAAGKAVTLFETKKGGRIAGLRLGPADAFVGKDRDVLLRITWDGDKKPAVLSPVGDFFGYGWGKPAMGSCLLGTWAGMNYCNLPMPFDKAAKVELVSLKTGGAALGIRGELVVGDTPRKAYEGKFYAHWHRENPTTNGKPFTYLETLGEGHIVGVALQAQGMVSGNTGFFEGDDITTVDGQMVIHGTGSEDSFNGGWYDVPDRWDRQFARPFSGCMAYQKHLGRTGAYRFFVGDAYSYRKSILQTIEHAPERNEGLTDYTAVTYFYSKNRPTIDFKVPSLKERQVVDLKEIVFAVSWTTPIISFSFADATISRTSVPAGDKQVRALSFRAKGGDWFGPAFISLGFDLPANGKYKVFVNVVKGPEQGIVQLYRDETPVGDPVDLYAAKPTQVNDINLGDISGVDGMNNLMFKVIDKNPASKALGFDLVEVKFQRTR